MLKESKGGFMLSDSEGDSQAEEELVLGNQESEFTTISPTEYES